jgi:sulfate permease, SulP family
MTATALTGDLLAAVIVTIMLIPQSLAYAMLAGLPPETGLYASIAPIVLYAIFGSSRALAVGPVAVVSSDDRRRHRPHRRTGQHGLCAWPR